VGKTVEVIEACIEGIGLIVGDEVISTGCELRLFWMDGVMTMPV
jgi:hypothetical protein